ncbi:Hsp70 family protein [Microbacterium sp. NPDC056003]|uniref:Hsp70 family protein n=1 Tax=Microbacterium sp. NPDC056003 TaxID=3345676 RepID=UPI0035D877CC
MGTSRIAAATAHVSPVGDVRVAPFRLGRAADTAASAAFVTEGELVFGDAADRRGLTNPGRLLRGFVRRIGDDVPFLVGDRRVRADELFARVISWVVDAVTERQGTAPAALAVTAPQAWGSYRHELIAASLVREGWPHVDVLPVAEAAARHYETTHPLPADHAIAVYDLGGGTFDAVVVRKDRDDRVATVGEPTSFDDFGGSHFDDAVFQHVITAAGVETHMLGEGSMLGLKALRRECTDAKEALSFDSETTIPVLVEGHHVSVRLTRAEFEAMIEPGVVRTVEALTRSLEGSGLDVEDVDAILMIGGSSRIPRITQLLSERLDRPLAVDVDPKAAAVLGAAHRTAELRLRGDSSQVVDTGTDSRPVEEPPPAPAAAPASRWRWFRHTPALT